MIMDYEAQQEAVKSTLEKANKNGNSTILSRVAEEKSNEDKHEVLGDILHMLLRETMDMIKDGEMTLEEAIDDFASAAKAIDVKDLKVSSKSKGKEKSEPMEDEIDD